MNYCPANTAEYHYEWEGSECLPELGPRIYRTNCTERPATNHVLGFEFQSIGICPGNSACLDFNPPIHDPPAAFCVYPMEDDPNGNRFAVDMDLLRNGGNDIRVEIILENGDVEGLNSNEDGSSTDGNSSVDAMCIGSEGSEGSEGSCSISSVKAVSMQITAQSVKELFGAISYTTVDGGLSRCTGCSSLVQNPSPKMAQHFVFDIVLASGITQLPKLSISVGSNT